MLLFDRPILRPIFRFRRLQTALYQFDIRLRCANAARRLLLKAVQDIDRVLEPHRVDGAKRVGVEVADHFKYSGTEPFPRLGIGMLTAILGYTERGADMANHRLGHRHQMPLAGPHPAERLLAGSPLASDVVYPISRIFVQPSDGIVGTAIWILLDSQADLHAENAGNVLCRSHQRDVRSASNKSLIYIMLSFLLIKAH